MKYAMLFALALGVFGLSAYVMQEGRSAKDSFEKTGFRTKPEAEESSFVSKAFARPGDLMKKTGEVEGVATVVFSNDQSEAEVFADLPEPVGGRYELRVQQPNERKSGDGTGVVLVQQKAGFIGKIRIPDETSSNSQLMIVWIPNKNSRPVSVLFTIDLR